MRAVVCGSPRGGAAPCSSICAPASHACANNAAADPPGRRVASVEFRSSRVAVVHTFVVHGDVTLPAYLSVDEHLII